MKNYKLLSISPLAFARVLIMLTLIAICVTDAYAQPGLSTTNKKAIQYFTEAGNYNKRAQFREAIEVLEKAIKKDDQFLEAVVMAGVMHERLFEREQAIKYYKQAIALAPESGKVRRVYLTLTGELLKSGRYQQADSVLQSYQSLPSGSKEEAIVAERLSASISFALQALANPVDFDPQPMPAAVNIYPLQYFPAVTVDGQTLIFTAREGNLPQHDEDIYISYLSEAGEWQRPAPLSPNINSPYNEGACTISADGRTIIFTTCQGRKSVGSCDLFISRWQETGWSVPENMGTPVNSPQWDSQPSLSSDGRTLYFVSNRPGGYGKRDIWVTTLSDEDEWQTPRNLGAKINTDDDDISPFIHFNDENLYFASKGHAGMGGFDLFKATRSAGAWGDVANLGYPINDVDDQISLFITAQGTAAYYAHETVENGRVTASKLFSFDLPLSARVSHRSNFLTGTVTNQLTGEPLEAELNLVDIMTEDQILRVKSDRTTGKYFVVLTEGKEYGIFINKPGYLFHQLSFNYLEKEELAPEMLDIQLQPIASGAETVLQNIFFDTNEYELQPKSQAALTSIIKFLTVNPTVSVEIAGHTDSSGLSAANLQLSEKRAQSVYNYLVKEGISAQRLNAKGYGDTQPMESNDTEEGKARNRRISLKITKS